MAARAIPGRSYFVGITSALLAALVWSMNFVVPFVIGPYTIFDFALFRFVISGIVGIVMLMAHWSDVQVLSARDWLVAAGLAFIGYVGFFLMVAGAAIYAGPVIAPAFLGLVPIVLSIAGNLRQGTVPWRALVVPLLLITAGLVLVNLNMLKNGATVGEMPSLLLGVGLTLGAVSFWTWFGLANQAALSIRPKISSTVWTALILVAGGVEMLVFFPIGSVLGAFAIPRLGLSWQIAEPLYLWGISLAILSSVGGSWAWTVASRCLPVALAAQLIVSETALGAVFGLAVHSRWPTLPEAAGLTALVAGVVIAIGVFYRPR